MTLLRIRELELERVQSYDTMYINMFVKNVIVGCGVLCRQRLQLGFSQPTTASIKQPQPPHSFIAVVVVPAGIINLPYIRILYSEINRKRFQMLVHSKDGS